MMPRSASPKAEYRQRQIQRANDSATLAELFPQLKLLRLDLAYFQPDGLTRSGALIYKVNVQHAKSIFTFACPNNDCIGGDFDLSAAIAEAVRARRKTTEGEVQCQGSRVKAKLPSLPCQNILRYKLTLGYA